MEKSDINVSIIREEELDSTDIDPKFVLNIQQMLHIQMQMLFVQRITHAKQRAVMIIIVYAPNVL